MLTGERIRELRERLGLSMRGFSKALGISDSSFSYWERGRRMPSIPSCYKIINFAAKNKIKINLDWLRPGEEDVK